MEYKNPISLEVISSQINHPVKLLTSRLQAPSYHLNWDRSARINNFPSPSFVQAPKLQWNLHQLRSGKVREGHFLNSRWRLPPMSWFIKVTHIKRPDLIDDRGWSVRFHPNVLEWGMDLHLHRRRHSGSMWWCLHLPLDKGIAPIFDELSVPTCATA